MCSGIEAGAAGAPADPVATLTHEASVGRGNAVDGRIVDSAAHQIGRGLERWGGGQCRPQRPRCLQKPSTGARPSIHIDQQGILCGTDSRQNADVEEYTMSSPSVWALIIASDMSTIGPPAYVSAAKVHERGKECSERDPSRSRPDLQDLRMDTAAAMTSLRSYSSLMRDHRD